MLSHRKLDLSFFFMAGPKSANLQQTSEAEIAEENNYRVLEKYVPSPGHIFETELKSWNFRAKGDGRSGP